MNQGAGEENGQISFGILPLKRLYSEGGKETCRLEEDKWGGVPNRNEDTERETLMKK